MLLGGTTMLALQDAIGPLAPSPGGELKGGHEVHAAGDSLLDEGRDLGWVSSRCGHRDTVRRMGPFRRLPGRLIAAMLAVGLVASGCALVGPALVFEAVRPKPTVRPIPSPSMTPSQPDDLSDYYQQQVDWTECGDAQCGTVRVPLDYEDPQGRSIELAVTRVPATGEAIGSLFVNPGGPGGSAIEYAQAADYIVSEQIRDHYDVIGVDPRGIGSSTPVDCLTDAEQDELAGIDATPDTPAEEQEILEASKLPALGCARDTDGIYRYVGTINTARDLDIVRAAVGEPVLNYLGKSYGTQIGAVYAELFPDRVGRMVLDGVLPPGLSMEEITYEQAKSFEEAFANFAADCATHDDCPYRGNGEEVKRQLHEFLLSLDGNPLKVGDRQLDEALATYAVLLYLYFPSYDYPELRRAMRSAVKDADGQPLIDLLDQRLSRGPDGRYLDNSTDAFYAVTCADRVGDVPEDKVRSQAEAWGTELPVFGEGLAWGMLACNGWAEPNVPPVTNVRAKGSAPILLVSTTHDPATPHVWGEMLAEQLDNARLLTWDDYSHTAYLEGSGCIQDAVDDYLLAGTLPPEGKVCGG